MNFKDLIPIMAEETLTFHNIKKWNEMGYTGKGIRILEVEQWDSDHGKCVTNQMRLGLPNA